MEVKVSRMTIFFEKEQNDEFLAYVLLLCHLGDTATKLTRGRAVYAMTNKLFNSDLFIPAHLHGTEAFYFSVLGIIFHCCLVLYVKVHFRSSYRSFIFFPKSI